MKLRRGDPILRDLTSRGADPQGLPEQIPYIGSRHDKVGFFCEIRSFEKGIASHAGDHLPIILRRLSKDPLMPFGLEVGPFQNGHDRPAGLSVPEAFSGNTIL